MPVTDWKKKFWSHVNKTDNPVECWTWSGWKDKDGYARFGHPGGEARKETGNERSAHRISYVLFNGFIDEDTMVLHRCNNSSCVNPFHLYVGDAQSNAEYREFSHHHGIYKINLDDANEIRRLYATEKNTYENLGKRFGISKTHTQRVVRGYSPKGYRGIFSRLDVPIPPVYNRIKNGYIPRRLNGQVLGESQRLAR